MAAKIKKWIIIVLVSVLALGAIVFLKFEFMRLSNCHISDKQEAVEVFDRYRDGIEDILQSEGLSVDYVEEYGDDESSYNLRMMVNTKDGGVLDITLEYGDYHWPEFSMFHYSHGYAAWNDCTLNLAEHQYVYDIAAYLCADRFSAEQLYTYLLAKQDTAKERLDTGETSPISEWSSIRSAFFYLGLVDYSLEKDDAGLFRARSCIMLPLYE